MSSRINKLWKSDLARKTRFYTENGKLCLAPGEMAYSAWTHFLRLVVGYWPSIPWYVSGANRMIQARDWSDCTCFEYGSGYSTVWYARRFRHVYAVEHDRGWLAKVEEMVAPFDNVTIFSGGADPVDYVRAIDRTGVDGFDLISIDGVHRNECFFHVVDRLKIGGFLVLDNTDVDDRQSMVAALPDHFEPEDVHVFAGYPNSFCHANETTICVRRQL